MATLASPIAYARAQTQSDSNGLTDANAIIFANEALLDFRRRLIAAGVDAAQTQEAYCNGVVPSGGNGSTFAYPTDMFFLKSIEVNFTDTNAQNYRVCRQIDVSNLSGNNSFSWLRKNGDPFNPQFDDRGDWYEIFPSFTASTNTSQAIRIFYFLEPTEYTATSDTVAYPESLDYRILAWRIASNYYYALNKMEEGDRFNEKYQERVEQLIATLGRGTQQPQQATALQISGWQF